MSCNDKPTDCTPCRDCEPAAPVLPRCDVALPDGTYTNATVTVQGGCIIALQDGRPPQYAPPDCCVETGGGGGSDEPCDCPPGEPGDPATIEIASIFSIGPNEAPRAENIGTATNAVINLYIPRGQPGQDSIQATGVNSEAGGIVIENGLVSGLPSTWPPVLYVTGMSNTTGVTFDISAPDPMSGLVKLNIDLSGYDTALRRDFDQKLQALQDSMQTQITALQQSVATLSQSVTQLSSQVSRCCP